MIAQSEIEFHRRRFSRLQDNRAYYNALLQEVMELVVPYRANVYRKLLQGEVPMAKIWDTTAMHANFVLSHTMHGVLTNPASDFFDVTWAQPELAEDQDSKVWLEDFRKTALREVRDSNYDSQATEMWSDQTSAGQGIIYEGENEERTSLWFQTCHVAECYMATNQYGIVDTLYRRYPMTARNMAKQFGEDKLPEKVKTALAQRPEDEFNVLHVTCPREDRNFWSTATGDMPYASIYIDDESGHLLREEGYVEFPWLTPRWLSLTGDPTGRSPAMFALPDIRTANAMMRLTLRGGEKTVDPALLIPDDGVLRPLYIKSGGLNYFDAKRPDLKIEQLPTGQPEFGLEMLTSIRQQIIQAFLLDLLDFQRDPQMTAFEVMQRVDKQNRVLSPMMGRQHSEFLRPFVARTFGVLWRQGKIAPPPARAQGALMKVVYTSPLARGSSTAEAQATQQALQALLPLGQIWPSIYDNYDSDKIAREMYEALQAPARLLVDPKVRDQLRQRRQAEMEEQKKQQQVLMGLEAAKRAGEAGKNAQEAQLTAAQVQAAQGPPMDTRGGLGMMQ